MKQQQQAVNGPVALKNVAAFMAMTQRLIHRPAHLPGIGVCSSHSGYGKTWASVFAGAKTRAVRVEVGDTWTRNTLLKKIMSELGFTDAELRKRMSAAEMAEKVIFSFGNDPDRPLIIDEADRAVDRGMIETVRELHEHAGMPVILIGEERLPAKLLGVERVHNRVLDWMQAQPCDLDDAKALAKAFVPKVAFGDDLLESIVAASMGRARRIVVNIERAAEFARNKSYNVLPLAKWTGGAWFTGEPPAQRAVQPFARKAA